MPRLNPALTLWALKFKGVFVGKFWFAIYILVYTGIGNGYFQDDKIYYRHSPQ